MMNLSWYRSNLCRKIALKNFSFYPLCSRKQYCFWPNIAFHFLLSILYLNQFKQKELLSRKNKRKKKKVKKNSFIKTQGSDAGQRNFSYLPILMESSQHLAKFIGVSVLLRIRSGYTDHENIATWQIKSNRLKESSSRIRVMRFVMIILYYPLTEFAWFHKLSVFGQGQITNTDKNYNIFLDYIKDFYRIIYFCLLSPYVL